MARNKHTTALFEVIDRRRPAHNTPRDGILSSLRGWFRSGDGGSPAAGGPSPAPDAVPAPPPLPAARQPVSVDPDRGEISLRLTYASAVTATIAILAALGIAFLAGQRASAPRPAIATNLTGELRNMPPSANVMNLADVPNLAGADQPGEFTALPPAGNDTAGAERVERAPAPPRTRSIGLNYVIMQSYPDQKTADEAKQILAQHGLDSTVEKGLPGWGTPTWYTVVGLEGFARITSNPPLDAYSRKVRDISDKFAKKGSFKAFEPTPYKWGKK